MNANASDTRIALADEAHRIGIAQIDIHQAELMDLDELVVEIVAALPEQDRPFAAEAHRERDDEEERRQQHDE